MAISMIAAVGRGLEIGRGNSLIWHIHEDMRYFRRTTTGGTVIMGRKTFESLPHALPNRRNIVLSSNAAYSAQGAEVFTSAQQALNAAQGEEVFIIGGESIYRLFLPLASKLYLTEIDDSCGDADAFFPQFDRSLYDKETAGQGSENGISYSFCVYSKK